MGDEQKIGYEELLAASKAGFEDVPDFTVAVEEEFALLDPGTLGLVGRFEEVQQAAAAGVPPLVAAHSGLAEIAASVAAGYPPELAQLTSFPTGDAGELRRRLRGLLELPPGVRRQLGLAARRAVEQRWSWARVSQRLLDPLAF